MARPQLKHRARLPWLIAWVGLCFALPAAVDAQTAGSSDSSITGSISSGMQRVGEAMKPAPKINSKDDPTALDGPGKPGVELYVAVAKLYEEKNSLGEAEAYYRRALQVGPKDLRALLGYARLKDRQGEAQESLRIYQRAMQYHPNDASVYNNLAVHYARGAAYRDAIAALDRAVRLRPREPRYRNNLAALFVETGRPQEAFDQLRSVYDESVAHYNLGFLLQKKGLKTAAAQEFMRALQINPGFAQARRWVEYLSLSNGAPATGLPQQPPPQFIESAQTTAVPSRPTSAPATSFVPPPPQIPPPQYVPSAPQYRQPAPQYGTSVPAPGASSFAPPPPNVAAPTNDVRVLPSPPIAPSTGWVPKGGTTRPADAGGGSVSAPVVRRLPPVQDDPDLNPPELIAPAPPR